MSEQMTVATGVPEVHIGQTQPAAASVPPTFSGAWGDMAKDMAAIEAEMTPQPAQPAQEQPPAAATAPESKPVEAAQPQTAPAPVAPAPAPPAPEVPEKFRGADGKLDQEKLFKSYLEAEKTLKRLQNAKPEQAAAQPSQPQQVQAPQAPQVAPQVTPFELQVAQDMINEAAAQGYAMPPAQAIAQARVQVRLFEAAQKASAAQTFAKVEAFEQTLAEQENRRQLQAIAQSNPEILTPQGYAELVKIREERPWLNAAPEPWKEATLILLAQKSQKQPGQVQMPIPTGAQQTAPPLPVTPAPVAQSTIRLDTPQQLESYLKTLTPAQEAEYWKRQGLKWDTPPNKAFY